MMERNRKTNQVSFQNLELYFKNLLKIDIHHHKSFHLRVNYCLTRRVSFGPRFIKFNLASRAVFEVGLRKN